jgi:hypothetical protein
MALADINEFRKKLKPTPVAELAQQDAQLDRELGKDSDSLLPD